MDSINSFVIEPVEKGLDQQRVLRKKRKEWTEECRLATSSPGPGEIERNKSKQHNSSEATKVAGGARSVSVGDSVSDSDRRPSDGSIVPRQVTKTHGERVRNRKKKTKLVLIT